MPRRLPHWRTYSTVEPRSDNYLPFRSAARAAGDIPEKVIRHWIDRQLVNFDADEARGEVIERGVFKGHVPHRRFSELDVIRIALVDRLTELGFTIEEASDGVERAIKNICDEKNLRYYPPERRENTKIIDGLTATSIWIRLSKRRVRDTHTGRMERMKEITVVDEKELKKVHPDNEGALIILFTGDIVRDVYKRLNEMQRED